MSVRSLLRPKGEEVTVQRTVTSLPKDVETTVISSRGLPSCKVASAKPSKPELCQDFIRRKSCFKIDAMGPPAMAE
jgi:hypothetical protein